MKIPMNFRPLTITGIDGGVGVSKLNGGIFLWEDLLKFIKVTAIFNFLGGEIFTRGDVPRFSWLGVYGLFFYSSYSIALIQLLFFLSKVTQRRLFLANNCLDILCEKCYNKAEVSIIK